MTNPTHSAPVGVAEARAYRARLNRSDRQLFDDYALFHAHRPEACDARNMGQLLPECGPPIPGVQVVALAQAWRPIALRRDRAVKIGSAVIVAGLVGFAASALVL